LPNENAGELVARPRRWCEMLRYSVVGIEVRARGVGAARVVTLLLLLVDVALASVVRCAALIVGHLARIDLLLADVALRLPLKSLPGSLDLLTKVSLDAPVGLLCFAFELVRHPLDLIAEPILLHLVCHRHSLRMRPEPAAPSVAKARRGCLRAQRGKPYAPCV